MLMEAVTLHRRFPYAVLGAFFFFDKGAATDHIRDEEQKTGKRRSTFLNAHARLRLFTGRTDPAGRDEQFEKFYILIVEATPNRSEVTAYEVGNPDIPVPLETVIDNFLKLVAEQNPDFYEFDDGQIIKL